MVEVPSDWLKAFPMDTASGSIASFTDGADDLPLKNLIVDINPIQDLSNGDPSPENICPISGWDAVGVEQSGENVGRIYAYSANGLSTPQTTPVVSNSYGTTISTTDSQADKIVITQTRHDGSTDTSYLNGFFIVGVDNIINGQRYYFRAKVNVTANPLNTARLYGLWNGRGNAVPLSIANEYVTGTFVASISDERRYLEIRCAGASFEMSEIMFMLAEDMSSPYEPYTGRSININLGQTVYGGKLDVLSGVLTVDRAMVDLSALTWLYQSNWQSWYTDYISSIKGTTENTKKPDFLSEQYPVIITAEGITSGYTSIGITSTIRGASGCRIVVRNGDTVNKPTGLLVYELAAPIEIQLSPNQVNSLLGVNNIWADSGDTEVEYRADPDLYIQRKMPEVPVEDVQINGTSIVNNGVANVPVASANNVGVVKILSTNGIYIDSNNSLVINKADTSQIKNGAISSRPIVPANQSNATFYGLAKSAGDTTQSQSSNVVGQYTEDAKSAISEMLNGSVAVSGTTPTIVAKSGIRYVCGEVLSLDFTPSQTGICDVVFTSGSTATVLTVPSTIKWANGFDPTSLDANTTYEINVMDGLGAVMAWT